MAHSRQLREVLVRVLLLGGSGRYGSMAARHLATSETISEVAIAGRSRDALTCVASEIGEKARAVQVDIHDEPGLASVATDYDIVVNAAGPEWEVLLPGLRAAIAARTNYCDLGADGRTAEKQLELDPMARDRGIVAVVGIGFDPGLDNLLAVHASRRFDRVEVVEFRFHLALPDELLVEAIDGLRASGRVDPSWQLVLQIASGPVRVYRDGRWMEVEPLQDPVEIMLPQGGTVSAHPVAMPEPITLPRYLPGVQSVRSVLGVSPPQVAQLLFGEAEAISRGERSTAEATRSFLEAIATDPGRWLGTTDLTAGAEGWSMSLVATGWKDRRQARLTCRPDPLLESTTIPLTVAAVRILRGEVPARGVLPPEACFEPMPFFEEAARYAEQEEQGEHRDEPLVRGSFEWLS